jgi:O-acetyl-ADP-ribose deacetylase (regulator of RNase III)
VLAAPGGIHVKVEAIRADITTLAVDAIVNAANPALAGGGGVDGAIHRAAGPEELHAACRALGGCAPGEAKATPGFALPAKYIIHTVGPIWEGGDQGEDEVLASCYRRSLEVADEIGARWVAFPSVATGVYGFPHDRAAHIAIDTVQGTRTGVSRVLLVAFDETTFRLYTTLLGHQ